MATYAEGSGDPAVPAARAHAVYFETSSIVQVGSTRNVFEYGLPEEEGSNRRRRRDVEEVDVVLEQETTVCANKTKFCMWLDP